VWLKGEDSTKIHTGFGGGIWTAFLKPDNTLSLGRPTARAFRIYFYAGFVVQNERSPEGAETDKEIAVDKSIVLSRVLSVLSAFLRVKSRRQ